MTRDEFLDQHEIESLRARLAEALEQNQHLRERIAELKAEKAPKARKIDFPNLLSRAEYARELRNQQANEKRLRAKTA